MIQRINHTFLHIGLMLLLGLVAVFAQAKEIAVPTLQARVTDLTQTFSVSQQQALESQLQRFEQQSGHQVVVLMLPTTGNEGIETFAVRVFEQWRLGHKDRDDGILLLVAKQDRTVRIEVGYGLEGYIPDVVAGRIIRQNIIPNFANGQFYQGIQSGVNAIIDSVSRDGASNDGLAQNEPSTVAKSVSNSDSISPAFPGSSMPASRPMPNQPPEHPSLESMNLSVHVIIALISVPLMLYFVPVVWFKQRSVLRYLVNCISASAVAFLLGLFVLTRQELAVDSAISGLLWAMGAYFFFMLPYPVISFLGNILLQIVAAFGRGGGGGGRGGGRGGGGFSGGGGRSGGGGASGRW